MMKRTQIYIPETVHQAVEMLARNRREPMAKVLRHFIVSGLEREKKSSPAKGIDPLINLKLSGGPKNLSSDMDKYLYDK